MLKSKVFFSLNYKNKKQHKDTNTHRKLYKKVKDCKVYLGSKYFYELIMGHFGDCCDPFMRFRMTLNDYDAILSVATETPRCTLVVVVTVYFFYCCSSCYYYFCRECINE